MVAASVPPGYIIRSLGDGLELLERCYASGLGFHEGDIRAWLWTTGTIPPGFATRMGATTAFVSGYRLQANALYRSVMGPEHELYEPWVKEWSS